jgi:hypothetical protein
MVPSRLSVHSPASLVPQSKILNSMTLFKEEGKKSQRIQAFWDVDHDFWFMLMQSPGITFSVQNVAAAGGVTMLIYE